MPAGAIQPQTVDTVNDPEPARGNGLIEGDYSGGPRPPGRIAGDWNDDDGRYIEELFEPFAQLARIVKGLEPIIDQVPHGNRMISRQETLANVGALLDPQLVLPEDPNRVSITLTSDIAFKIAESLPLLNGAAVIDTTVKPLVLVGYTGSLCVVGAAGADTSAKRVLNVISIVNYDDQKPIGG